MDLGGLAGFRIRRLGRWWFSVLGYVGAHGRSLLCIDLLASILVSTVCTQFAGQNFSTSLDARGQHIALKWGLTPRTSPAGRYPMFIALEAAANALRPQTLRVCRPRAAHGGEIIRERVGKCVGT